MLTLQRAFWSCIKRLRHWSWKCFGWDVSVWMLNCLFSGWAKDTLSVLYLISSHCCRNNPARPRDLNVHSFLTDFLSFFFLLEMFGPHFKHMLRCVFQTNVTTRPHSDVLHKWIYAWKWRSVFAHRQCLRVCVCVCVHACVHPCIRACARARMQASMCLPPRRSIHWESIQCFPSQIPETNMRQMYCSTSRTRGC